MAFKGNRCTRKRKGLSVLRRVLKKGAADRKNGQRHRVEQINCRRFCMLRAACILAPRITPPPRIKVGPRLVHPRRLVWHGGFEADRAAAELAEGIRLRLLRSKSRPASQSESDKALRDLLDEYESVTGEAFEECEVPGRPAKSGRVPGEAYDAGRGSR